MLGFIISTRKDFVSEFIQLISKEAGVYTVGIQLSPTENYSDSLSVFMTIYETLEYAIKSYEAADLRNSFFMIDEVINWLQMDPMQPLHNAERVYAMLALTFPESNFFALNGSYNNRDENLFYWFRKSLSENIERNDVLFDPFMFRSSIKEKINKQSEASSNVINERHPLAHAIDEEKEYAYFHGYIAYKMGYRCHLFTSKSHLDNFQKKPGNSGAAIQFEDLYLNFPDQQKKEHLSKLRERDEKYSFLALAQKRFIVTSDHENTVNIEDNEIYTRHKNIKKISKPSSGIFDMAVQCGIAETYWRNWDKSIKKSAQSANHQNINSGGHGAPGIMLVIAEKLLSRANTILKNIRSSTDAVHVAVLALEAKELLGGKTPTLTLLAVSLQQQAEVIAECLFWGVEYNKNEVDRLKDIEFEVDFVSKWFSKDDSVSERQKLNAKLIIVQLLAKTCSEYGRFDEELAYLRAALKLQLSLSRHQHILKRALKPFHIYIEYSLKSISNFLILVLCCILAFSGVYFIYSDFSHSLWDSFLASTRFFFTLTVSDKATHSQQSWSDLFDDSLWGSLILSLQGAIAFSNLSLLLSQLYLKISRR